MIYARRGGLLHRMEKMKEEERTMKTMILPEGRYVATEENKILCGSVKGLLQAMEEERVVEGVALQCDEGHGITVSLGAFTGFIPWEEGALGLADGSVREIAVMSRIGHPVAVIVTEVQEKDGEIIPLLSRSLAQKKARDHVLSLKNGTVLPATVTHLDTFGAFVDVGCGVASLISIDRISISRIHHPAQRFMVGQEIYVAILEHDWKHQRVRVTHRELLGTWEENARRFAVGMTLPGVVRSIKNYGVFVELSPNFSGLAEVVEGLTEGQRVSVYIKGLLCPRMKCKLLIIGSLPDAPLPTMEYVLPPCGVLEQWDYAPEGCQKLGSETLFSEYE